MKGNAFLAIILGIGLIIGETIRSFGQQRNWFFIIDDFIFGFLLIFGGILVLKKKRLSLLILISGWSASLGMTYGSFFSKLNEKNNLKSNIDDSFLIFLVGLAFVTSIFGLIWVIYISSKKQG